MADLLFLCQRLPYPPNKGEKIRAFHELKFLSKQYDVHLGCLVDDPADLAHIDALRPLCRDIHAAPIDPKWAKLTCLTGLLTNEGLSVTFFRDRSLQAWVDKVLARTRPDIVFVYSSNMAPYVLGKARRLIADIVDVDSEKWRALAETAKGPMRHVYRREWRKIAALEAQLVHASERTLLVSNAEAALLRRLVPDGANRIQGVSNGVDHRYFDPTGFTGPQQGDAPEFVFTGTMDYPPNADAVAWFANAILPLIRQVEPDARFTVAGANPSRETQGLADLGGVTVTGRVPDIRPFLARCTAAVAPMRIARGIQNKVLEAMAMARPVVLTSGALEGIDAIPGQDVLLADTEQDFANACLGAIQGLHPGIGASARGRIVRDYDWDTCLAALDTLPRPAEKTVVPA
jgi:sugar transferase (PEP-CTERM/EpsH1 system associated)